MNVTWKPENWTGGRESERVTQEQAAASFAFNRFQKRFQIWSHLDSEIGLDSKEARDKETRLHRHLGAQSSTDLVRESLVDHCDQLLMLATVLLHIKGQPTREPALMGQSLVSMITNR